MTKATTTYWNNLGPDSHERHERWTAVKGLEGMDEELALSIDPMTGEYPRPTRFLGACRT